MINFCNFQFDDLCIIFKCFFIIIINVMSMFLNFVVYIVKHMKNSKYDFIMTFFLKRLLLHLFYCWYRYRRYILTFDWKIFFSKKFDVIFWQCFYFWILIFWNIFIMKQLHIISFLLKNMNDYRLHSFKIMYIIKFMCDTQIDCVRYQNVNFNSSIYINWI